MRVPTRPLPPWAVPPIPTSQLLRSRWRSLRWVLAANPCRRDLGRAGHGAPTSPSPQKAEGLPRGRSSPESIRGQPHACQADVGQSKGAAEELLQGGWDLTGLPGGRWKQGSISPTCLGSVRHSLRQPVRPKLNGALGHPTEFLTTQHGT